MKWLLSIPLVVLLGCNTTESPDTEILPEFLINDWVHSYEEDDSNSEYQIFRPADYMEFPVERYRQSYKLMDDGVLEFLAIFDGDGQSYHTGTWTYNEVSKELYIDGGGMNRLYRIIELAETIMRVEVLPTPTYL